MFIECSSIAPDNIFCLRTDSEGSAGLKIQFDLVISRENEENLLSIVCLRTQHYSIVTGCV